MIRAAGGLEYLSRPHNAFTAGSQTVVCFSALERAQEIEIINDLHVRAFTAPHFIASKVQTFEGRGPAASGSVASATIECSRVFQGPDRGAAASGPVALATIELGTVVPLVVFNPVLFEWLTV